MSAEQAIFRSRSPAQTEALGRALGAVLVPGDVVGLIGELGGGKTCFVRGAATGAGVDDLSAVSSPTFTLVNEYPGRLSLVHIDLYRLAGADELWEIGIDHYLGGEGACLIEWFDRFADELAGDRALQLRFVVTGDSERRLEATASDARHRALAGRWTARTATVARASGVDTSGARGSTRARGTRGTGG